MTRTINVKDWKKFQHFKDRKPPWIKLYRDLLDDLEWHDLDSGSAKVLVMLWLIASEDDGRLPVPKKLAFRLRMSEERVSQHLSKLHHWLGCEDINPISDGYQDDAPETETETETDYRASLEREHEEIFWPLVTLKKSKGQSLKAYVKARKDGATAEELASGMRRYATERSGQDPKFTKHPATWLNAKCWLDDSAPSARPADDSEALWKIRVSGWMRAKIWDERHGPPPGKPGCQVPSQFLTTDAA